MTLPKGISADFIGSTSRQTVESVLEATATFAESQGTPIGPATLRYTVWRDLLEIDPEIRKDEWGYLKMTHILNEMIGQDVTNVFQNREEFQKECNRLLESTGSSGNYDR